VSAPPTLLISAGPGAVLFDLDGTLADTDPLHARAWQLLTRSRFGLSFTWADYRNACIVEGMSPADFLLRLGADVRSAELQAAKTCIFRRLLRHELRLAPGAETFLAHILTAGIAVAIVSSGSRGSVDAFLDTLWPGAPPAVSVSREDTTHHKPHPEPYLFALAQLSRSPADCLAIEDTDRGVLSARRAGLRAVKVADGDVPAVSEADIVVASLADLSVLSDGCGGLIITKAEAPGR